MRLASLTSFGLAGIGTLFLAPASASEAPQPPKAPLPFVVPQAVYAGPAKGSQLKGRVVTAGGCTSNYSSGADFVGIPGAKDIAGGNVSSVLSGYGNEACDVDDAIGSGYLNVIGGSSDNGAAQLSFIGSGQSNAVTGEWGFIGAGSGNGVSGNAAFVGAGEANQATTYDAFVGAGNDDVASGTGAFVGAGYANEAGAQYTFVGGGDSNKATVADAFVGGGFFNRAASGSAFVGAGGGNIAAGPDSVVVGGSTNSAGGTNAFVGGGSGNTIGAQAELGAIGGGYQNDVSAAYATIPGGSSNTASGPYSFAAGYHADATQTGSFVWSDYVSGSAVVKDSGPNQFVVRARGGIYLYSSESLTAGVTLHTGSGTWESLSDRSAKTDIAPLDDAAILAKVATLPVSTWQYKSEAGVRHVGPMAQDFYAAFGVGEDDRHITSIDEDGVALAAIKALHRENVSLQADNDALRARLAALEQRVDAIDDAKHESYKGSFGKRSRA